MRIFNQQIPGVIKAYNQQKKVEKTGEPQIQRKSDGVEISSEARYFALACQALKELPEPNNGEKIAELRQAIKTGTYQVKNEDIAEKILEESYLDELI